MTMRVDNNKKHSNVYHNSFFTSKKNNKFNERQDAFLEAQIQSQKVDEFFGANKHSSQKFSVLSLIGSAAGVVSALLLFGKKQNPNIKINSVKNFFKKMKLEYELPQILGVSLAGIAGGLAGGLIDDKETKKIKKIKEGAFQFLNLLIPTVLVDQTIKFLKNRPKLNKNVYKAVLIPAALVGGVATAVVGANIMDNKIFDKNDLVPDRKMKAKDFIVHVDDIFGVLALAKLPIANQLHVDKILPALYTWCGYRVGEK